MNILLTNYDLCFYGGSETFTITLYKELIKRGHQVDVFTFRAGEAAKDIPTVITSLSGKHYDLALVNHNTCLTEVKKSGCADYIIYTCHSRFEGVETPIQGANDYVAVSEEIRDSLNEKGFKASVIRNPVDMDRFSYQDPSPVLKNVLLLSNRCQKKTVDKIKEVCEELNVKFLQSGLNSKVNAKVEEEISKADIVITVGRGALESLSMGKQVLLYDDRPYNGKAMGDGMFTGRLGLDARRFNYSGRFAKADFTKLQLNESFKKYHPETGKENREYINNYHDVKKIVDKYFNLYELGKKPIDKSKSKVLIIAGVNYYHQSYSLSGIIKTQAQLLRENGHEVGIVVVKGMSNRDILESTGAKVYDVIEGKETTLANIKKVIGEYNYILTHDFAWLEYYEWLDLIMDQLENDYPEKKFVHFIHSAPSVEACPEWKKGRVKSNMVYGFANVTDAPRIAKHLQVPKSKVISIKYTHNFIDEAGGDENLWNKLDIIDKDFVGFYPAHPMDGKNCDKIFPVVKAIKDQGYSIKYIFTMNGCKNGNKNTKILRYKQQIKDLGIEDNIIFLHDYPEWANVVEYETIKKIWKRTNLFILPSVSEVNSSILLEAMFNKCIIIANQDFPVFKEQIGNGAIYHPFGAWHCGMKSQDEGSNKAIADWVIKMYLQSHNLYSHNRIIKNYNRQSIYGEYKKVFNNEAFKDEAFEEAVIEEKPKKKISVVIPVLNVTPIPNAIPETIQWTKDCIASVKKAEDNFDLEIIVINNNPTDKNVYSDIQINNTENIGVPKSWNMGIEKATGEYVLILNSDVILTRDWAEQMTKWADHDGLVFTWVTKQLEGSGEGLIDPLKFNFPQVQGSCFMAKKSIFEKIGEFDERFFAYAEDRDYWIRTIRAEVPAYRANIRIDHKLNGSSSKITNKTIYNKSLIKKYGEVTLDKILKDSNKLFEEKWGFDINHFVF